jgi:hypothetical protein
MNLVPASESALLPNGFIGHTYADFSAGSPFDEMLKAVSNPVRAAFL